MREFNRHFETVYFQKDKKKEKRIRRAKRLDFKATFHDEAGKISGLLTDRRLSVTQLRAVEQQSNYNAWREKTY